VQLSVIRKLFVILDDLRAHRARAVVAWAAANAARIERFYLPPYAPEHTPDGFLNNDVKRVRRVAAVSAPS
jgi:DDE superfamily endonuclease